jgi:hypothetical protein
MRAVFTTPFWASQGTQLKSTDSVIQHLEHQELSTENPLKNPILRASRLSVIALHYNGQHLGQLAEHPKKSIWKPEWASANFSGAKSEPIAIVVQLDARLLEMQQYIYIRTSFIFTFIPCTVLFMFQVFVGDEAITTREGGTCGSGSETVCIVWLYLVVSIDSMFGFHVRSWSHHIVVAHILHNWGSQTDSSAASAGILGLEPSSS